VEGKSVYGLMPACVDLRLRSKPFGARNRTMLGEDFLFFIFVAGSVSPRFGVPFLLFRRLIGGDFLCYVPLLKFDPQFSACGIA